MAIPLTDFAQRKGQKRALEEYHNRKAHKRKNTAIALRGYRKAMKQQGYEAGKGASRKRTTTTTNKTQGKKQAKSNPFAKALKQGEERKKSRQEAQAAREAFVAQKDQKLRERRQHTRKLQKRTKKGQPIMKHMVDHLLAKMEKKK